MAERRQRIRLWGDPRNTGPAVTARPVYLIISQWCTRRPGVKCVQSNACPCRAANHPCTSGYPSENCRNRGPTQDPTEPRLTTNMSKNIDEAQEAASTLCCATPLFIYHQDAPKLSPWVLLRGENWPTLPTRVDTAYTALALTNTAALNPASPAAAGSSKMYSKRARPLDGRTASPSPPADQYSDVTLVASIGESDGDSYYVKSSKTHPRARPTRRTLRDTSVNWRKCTRLQRASS